jgi:hypothetical protein
LQAPFTREFVRMHNFVGVIKAAQIFKFSQMFLHFQAGGTTHWHLCTKKLLVYQQLKTCYFLWHISLGPHILVGSAQMPIKLAFKLLLHVIIQIRAKLFLGCNLLKVAPQGSIKSSALYTEKRVWWAEMFLLLLPGWFFYTLGRQGQRVGI